MVTSTTKSLASARKMTVRHLGIRAISSRAHNYLSTEYANKRKPLREVSTGQMDKRRKIDHDVTFQCLTRLNDDRSMEHADKRNPRREVATLLKEKRQKIEVSKSGSGKASYGPIKPARKFDLNSDGSRKASYGPVKPPRKYDLKTDDCVWGEENAYSGITTKLSQAVSATQEKSRTESEIRVAKPALREKADIKSKQQREREGKAVHPVIEKTEKTAQMDDRSSLDKPGLFTHQPEYMGAVGVVDEVTPRRDREEDLLSPEKALRAAMLKIRFAGTILKAEEKKLEACAHKCRPDILKKERAKLENKQIKEKARIAAEGRAAEAASRKKEEIESKQQRERAREAARLALEKVEMAVETDSNLEVQEELELLCGYRPSFHLRKSTYYDRGVIVASSWPVHHNRSPLEQLGLFIKPEYR